MTFLPCLRSSGKKCLSIHPGGADRGGDGQQVMAVEG
jgi:hypothetical protein